MFVGIISTTLKDRNTSRDAKKYIIIYTILVLVYESISRINFYNIDKTNYDVVLMAHIFKYLAFYTLFEGISKFLIQGTYSEMYDELKQRQRDQNHYKSILQKRMDLEIELKKMMEMSKNKYNTLINSIADSILIFEGGNISYVNSSADKLLKLLYKDRKKIEKLNMDDFIEYISTLRRDNNGEINKLSFVIKNSNGSSKVCDLTLECINNSICVVAIRDITDIGKVRTLKSELDNYIKDEKTKRQFYTNISHELRTPINVIYSALQLNDLYLEEKKKGGLEKNSENIKRNCLRLIRTINNFIDTNKISEGYLTPTMGIYNIVYLVENVAQSTLEYVNRFKMDLTFDADEEEIYVNCDMELLERVILNLLSNSVKYGQAGGCIFVAISCSDSDVNIRILNDSKKISDQEQSYIFDKFSKAQYDLNSRKEGSGLGLFISKALVELQGGDIRLDTFENGNRFTIRFDRVKDYECDYKMFTNNKFNELKEKVDIEFSDIYN
jgi:signal transduction histidine kinase